MGRTTRSYLSNSYAAAALYAALVRAVSSVPCQSTTFPFLNLKRCIALSVVSFLWLRYAMRERLQEFALSLHPEKTRLIEFGRDDSTGVVRAKIRFKLKSLKQLANF